MNPKCTSAIINLALVNKKLGKFEKAIELLESVTQKLDPKDASAHNNLANIYSE
jgi:tetratricopeptide (TPR) repeat protein